MFELVKGTQAASLYIAPGADDYAGLSHVAEKLQQDIKLVTGVTPEITKTLSNTELVKFGNTTFINIRLFRVPLEKIR